jgi:hypothetical protein
MSHLEVINMDKKIAGLLGAVAALTSLDLANAATAVVPNPADAMRVSSYAELLTPISNAMELQIADDAARGELSAAKEMQVAERHHHHHRHHRRYHHHHHHHHSYLATPRSTV